ncbi:MAG: SMC-Scp complex subunit ScpB [Candidatus Nanoarchaeia archaeon]
MEDYKNRVEAILFTTGRFMELQEIATLCNISSIETVKDVLDSLKRDYESRNSSLILIEEDGKWRLNIKKEYGYLTTKLLDNAEMDRPTQETLALIAYKNPVVQSEIVKMRGNTSYDHIKFLKDNNFITSEKYGRTRLLKLTPKFFEYFDVVEDQLKAKFSALNNIGVEPASDQNKVGNEDGSKLIGTQD